MAFVVGRFEVGDYGTWKGMLDSVHVGHKQSPAGHEILRSADNPREVFLHVEFPSTHEARSYVARLRASGVLDNVTVKTEPTVVEEESVLGY